ncbi:hypothetical protein [Geodermatophilus sp. SYSU D01176]
MGAAGWSLWAGEAPAAGVVLPTWLAVVLAIAVAIAPFVAAFLSYRTALRAITATNTATEATKATAAVTHALTASASNRQLIMQALELTRSEEPASRRQGLALLDGLSRLAGLSPNDALLIQSLTRPVIEGKLSEGRKLRLQNLAVSFRLVRPDPGEEVAGGRDRGDTRSSVGSPY